MATSDATTDLSSRTASPGGGWTRVDTTTTVVALAVLVITTVLATRGTSSIEATVFGWFNQAPSWLEPPVWAVMQLGTIGVAAVVGLVVGFAMRRPALALVFTLTPIAAWWAARAVKDLIERGRPAAEGLVVTIRGTADDGFGFPSGHSAVAFALATAIAPHLRGRWRALPFALATVVALARPYVGAHLPLDVIGGAALGILVAEAIRAVALAVEGRTAA